MRTANERAERTITREPTTVAERERTRLHALPSYRLTVRTAGSEGTVTLEIDGQDQALRLDGRPVRITAMQHALLYALCEHPGRLLTRERLAAIAHRRTRHARRSVGAVAVHLSTLRGTLRGRLRQAGATSPVRRVPDEGYVVDAATRVDATPARTHRHRNLEVDLDREHAYVDGRPARLQPLGARLLAALAGAGGATLDRATTMRLLYEGRPRSKARSPAWIVAQTRRDLADAGGPDPIETVPGQGYRIRS